MTEPYISNDGEHWGYEEEMHARNADLEREHYQEQETPHTEE